MKVLITINTAFNVSNFRAGLVRALIAEGHQVTALVPADKHVAQIAELGAEVVDLSMDKKGLSVVNDFLLVQRFMREFRNHCPDIILSYTIKNNIYGAIAAQRVGIPFIPTVTGLGTAFLGHPLLTEFVTRLYRKAFRPLPKIFFQNRDDQNVFLERRIVTEDQCVLVAGSGINLTRFSPSPLPSTGEDAVFLMIGRVLRDKGVSEYVNAARIVRKQIPTARFQLLGPAGYENRTAFSRKDVAAWEEEGILEYLGTCNDVRPAIAGADCVVLPSYREGTPRTLLEAASMGRPLIATNVPGCREVVEDGLNGALCKARDADSLAAACLKFLALSPDAKFRLGSASRAKAERQFDERLVIDAYKQALMDLT